MMKLKLSKKEIAYVLRAASGQATLPEDVAKSCRVLLKSIIKYIDCTLPVINRIAKGSRETTLALIALIFWAAWGEATQQRSTRHILNAAFAALIRIGIVGKDFDSLWKQSGEDTETFIDNLGAVVEQYDMQVEAWNQQAATEC